MPSHFLNQCWVIVNWAPRNKLQWNFNQNIKLFFSKMRLKMASAKWRLFRLGLDELRCILVFVFSIMNQIQTDLQGSSAFCFFELSSWASYHIRTIAGCACAGNAGNVFRRFSVPWCMSEPLTRGDGENVPGIPGACTTRNFTYLVRGPWMTMIFFSCNQYRVCWWPGDETTVSVAWWYSTQ